MTSEFIKDILIKSYLLLCVITQPLLFILGYQLNKKEKEIKSLLETINKYESLTKDLKSGAK